MEIMGNHGKPMVLRHGFGGESPFFKTSQAEVGPACGTGSGAGTLRPELPKKWF